MLGGSYEFTYEGTYMDRPGAGDCKERDKTGDSALEAGWHDTGDSEL